MTNGKAQRVVKGILIVGVLISGAALGQDATNGKPTLQETLTWLADKVPAAGTYSVSSGGSESDNTTTRFGANNCDVTVEIKKQTSLDAYMSTTLIPLASVRSVSISKVATGSKKYPTTMGPEFVYEVKIQASANDISWKQAYDDVPIVRGQKPSHDERSDRVDAVNFVVSQDELLAQRIANAVRYAADVCRAEKAKKPEPF
jgi:hypothetical protein